MALSALERWYAARCDGEWEHGYGISVETLDNPGWRVRIDLHGTNKASARLDRVVLERSEKDWIQYWVDKAQFNIACGALNLSESLAIFLQWFDE